MGCKECGKPKCNGKCGCNSPKVLQINNPAEYITFHKVSIPAAMGDSTTNPPKIGAYRNALVYYEADHTSWMYSTDGIPTLVTGEQGETGPQGPASTIAVGTTTTGEPGTQARVYNSGTDSNAVLNFEIPRGDVGPSVPLVQETGNSTTKAMSQNATTEALNGKQNTLTAGSNIQISGSTISATDTKYSAGNGITLTGTQFSADTDVLATEEDLEGYYTKPETDNLLAPKLEAEVVAELPTTGEEGKLYLTPKAHTTQTATGNPITASVAEESGKIESFKLNGDTYQQTYIGKNLFNFRTANIRNGYLNNNSLQYQQFYPDRSFILKCSPSTTYTISRSIITSSFRAAYTDTAVEDIPATSTTLQSVSCAGEINNNSGSSITITTGSNAQTLIIHYGHANNDADIIQASLESIQIEVGSTATSYEPFVGGQPSPNPDYPQPIQTVTGLQTITINGMDYPLDLGDIQLCKFGDDGNGNPLYKDRIYRDGDDWKVHKAVGKAELWKGTNWRRLNTSIADESRFSVKVSNTDTPTSDSSTTLVNLNSNYWPACSRIQTFQQTQGIAVTGASDFSVESFVAFVDSLKTSDVDGWKAWLTANMPVVYYPSTAPTDTTITDQALISQLEAIRTAVLENGTNTITNSATAPNLAGDMEVGYYGYNPRNRYDKWLWLDINNEYEQIGS